MNITPPTLYSPPTVGSHDLIRQLVEGRKVFEYIVHILCMNLITLNLVTSRANSHVDFSK